MTATQDQFAEVARRGQEAVATAMRDWTENIQRMAGGGTAQSGLPSAQQVVDNVFDFAEQMLASQREFAKRVLAVGAEASEAATSKMREAAESMTASSDTATSKPV